MQWNIGVAGIAASLPAKQSVIKMAQRGKLSAAEIGSVSEQAVIDSGIESLAVAGPNQSSASLAIEAGRVALNRSGLDLAEIGVHVHAAAHDRGKPPLWNEPLAIGAALNLPTFSFGVRAACDGLMGLEAICPRLIVQRQPAALLTTGDVWRQPDIDRYHTMPSLGFGDAGAALVLTSTPEDTPARLIAVHTASDGSLEGMHSAGGLMPDGENLRRRRRLFREKMPEPEIMACISQGVSKSVGIALADAGMGATNITYAVGSYLSLDLYEEEFIAPLRPLGFNDDQFSAGWDLGRRIGHTGPSDTLISLNYLMSEGSPGDTILAIGAAAGYEWTTAIFRLQ